MNGLLASLRASRLTWDWKLLLFWIVAGNSGTLVTVLSGYSYYLLLPLTLGLLQMGVLYLRHVRGTGWWLVATLIGMVLGPSGGGAQLYRDLLFEHPIDSQIGSGAGLNLTLALIALLQLPILRRNTSRLGLRAAALWIIANGLTYFMISGEFSFFWLRGLQNTYLEWFTWGLLPWLLTGGLLVWLLHSDSAHGTNRAVDGAVPTHRRN